jgi:hypothetical protein
MNHWNREELERKLAQARRLTSGPINPLTRERRGQMIRDLLFQLQYLRQVAELLGQERGICFWVARSPLQNHKDRSKPRADPICRSVNLLRIDGHHSRSVVLLDLSRHGLYQGR